MVLAHTSSESSCNKYPHREICVKSYSLELLETPKDICATTER